MVWGGISHHGVTQLVFINDGQGAGLQRNAGRRRGGLMADRYVNEVLRPVVLPYLAAHPGMILHAAHGSCDKEFLATEQCCDSPLAGIITGP